MTEVTSKPCIVEDVDVDDELTGTVERLRERLARNRDLTVKAGRRDGYEWARDTAEDATYLIRINELLENQELMDALFCHNACDDAYDACDHVMFHVFPEHYGDREESKDFWETVGGIEFPNPSESYVLGFLEGAAVVWDKIRDRVFADNGHVTNEGEETPATVEDMYVDIVNRSASDGEAVES